MTSAPMSAMIWVEYGPITIAVSSSTRTPSSGPLLATDGSLSRHAEAVPDVVAVAVGYYGEDDRHRRVADRCHVFADIGHGPRRPVHPWRFRDDCPCHPACQCYQHFPCDRTGFV